MEKKRDYVYGKRDRITINLRFYFHRLFQLMQAFFNKLKPHKRNKNGKITFLATGFNDIASIEEFFIKCNWYLPNGLIEYKILVISPFQIERIDLISDNRFSFISEHPGLYGNIDFILLNDWKQLFSFKNIFNINKIVIIDNNYFSYVESLEWQNLFYRCLNTDKKSHFSDISKQNFSKYKIEKSHKDRAACFVTGPSFSEYPNFSFDSNDLIVICNSIVKNTSFLEHTNGADILTFADPVFHFSFNKYSTVFRSSMLLTFKKYNFFIAIPMEVFPLMYSHYPELKDHLIGINYKRHQNSYNIPSLENMWVKDNANILTNLMIPMACSVVNKIDILGADGRKPDEKYFWAHNSSVQFDDLMNSVFEAHPSFFRDRDYKDYYDQHCQSCAELLEYCETYGKEFNLLTNSYIPAFSKRYSVNKTVAS
ncbi:hypothetical protein [Larkinella sp. C7]|uniref:hypothetical protein n=1 Tax=Larkinella sp. C7 TaxID=2576607 RepID=UPI001111376D|nr:hypothetical protein [Larkinella sp. C7]